MIKLIKLVLYRIKHNKAFLITYLILIPIVIAIAVYFTNSISYGIQIGVVGDIDIVSNDQIDYIHLDTIPDTSQLVLNQYDAIVTQEKENIKVISTKGQEYNQIIQLLVSGQLDSLPSTNHQRGSASNILGFLMMVILLLGGQIYKYYFDERAGINKRILSTSVHCYQYLLSHYIVVLCFLFIPAVTVICGVIVIFDIALSIALWQFILVLLLLCFFATSFGLWVNVLSKTLEESLMFGNMFAIVGTIVSGGFAQVTDNGIFNTIVQFFPQKQIMSLLNGLENNTTLPYLGIFYVLSISIILIIFAIKIEKRKLSFR
ncbi:ABC transporter permease [Thomasclavelia sp.]